MKPNEKLKEIREFKEKLSQSDFGAKFGVKGHTIGFIEQGRQEIPDKVALYLEKEYDIPFKWWKTGKDESDLCINEFNSFIPNDMLKSIRFREGISKEKFAQKLELKAGYIIDNIECGKQKISDELALKLEKEYNIPFKWWKTGIGEPSFSGNTLQKHSLSLNDEFKNWGSRLVQVQTKNGYSYSRMAELIRISESRLDEIYTKSPEPKFKEIIAIQENIDVSLSWLFFNILPTEKATQEHPKNSDNLDVLSSLSPDKMDKLLDLLGD